MTEITQQASESPTGIPAAFTNRVALSRSEVSETLGCSEDFVDTLIADGALKTRKIRSLVFIVARDVWELMDITSPQSKPVSANAKSLLHRMKA